MSAPSSEAAEIVWRHHGELFSYDLSRNSWRREDRQPPKGPDGLFMRRPETRRVTAPGVLTGLFNDAAWICYRFEAAAAAAPPVWGVLRLPLVPGGYQDVTADPGDVNSWLLHSMESVVRRTAPHGAPLRFELRRVGGSQQEETATFLGWAVHDSANWTPLQAATRRSLKRLLPSLGRHLMQRELFASHPAHARGGASGPVAATNLLRHLHECTRGRPDVWAGCPTCLVFVDELRNRTGGSTGIDAVDRLALATRLRAGDLSDFETLMMGSRARPEERERAAWRIRNTTAEAAIAAFPMIEARWPVSKASLFKHAPWSLLLWCRHAEPEQGTFRPGQVYGEGWSVTRAGQSARIAASVLKHEHASPSARLVAALAMSEIAPTNRHGIRPDALLELSRLWELEPRLPVAHILTRTAHRLTGFYVRSRLAAQSRRHPEVRRRDAAEVWEVLKALPRGHGDTRNEWLRVYSQMPAIRDVMQVEAPALDRHPVLKEAWHWPMRAPKPAVLAGLLTRPASDATAADDAELALSRTWAAIRCSGVGAGGPPTPSVKSDGTIRSSLRYWRSFLWGAGNVGGEAGRKIWASLLDEGAVSEGCLDAAAEHQFWEALRRYSKRGDARWDAPWGQIAAERLRTLLDSGLATGNLERLSSLQNLLSERLADPCAAAELWTRTVTEASRSATERQLQYYLGGLEGRDDLTVFFASPSARELLRDFALRSRDVDKYLVVGAIRLMARMAGFSDRLDYLADAKLHGKLWMSPAGRAWVERLADCGAIAPVALPASRTHLGVGEPSMEPPGSITEPSDAQLGTSGSGSLGPQLRRSPLVAAAPPHLAGVFLELVASVASGATGRGVHGADEQLRVTALQVLADEDLDRCLDVAIRLVSASDELPVVAWLGRVQTWTEGHYELLARTVLKDGARDRLPLLAAVIERSGLDDADVCAKLERDVCSALQTAESINRLGHLLSALSRVPPHRRSHSWASTGAQAVVDVMERLTPRKEGHIGLPLGVQRFLDAGCRPTTPPPTSAGSLWIAGELERLAESEAPATWWTICRCVHAMSPAPARKLGLLRLVGGTDPSLPDAYFRWIQLFGERQAEAASAAPPGLAASVEATLVEAMRPLSERIENLGEHVLGDAILGTSCLSRGAASRRLAQALAGLDPASLHEVWRGMTMVRLLATVRSVQRVVHSLKGVAPRELMSEFRALPATVQEYIAPDMDTHEAPSGEVRRVLTSMLDRLGWAGRVQVNDVAGASSKRATFASTDVELALKNMVGNSLRHGGDPVRATLHGDRLELRNPASARSGEVNWLALTDALNGPSSIGLKAAGVSPGHGLATLKQVISRNRDLRVSARLDSGSVLFTLHWRPT